MSKNRKGANYSVGSRKKKKESAALKSQMKTANYIESRVVKNLHFIRSIIKHAEREGYMSTKQWKHIKDMERQINNAIQNSREISENTDTPAMAFKTTEKDKYSSLKERLANYE